MAMHHQYYGVNKAIHETLRASAETGDHKIGVIWHTQGSGKSLSMVFFTGKIIKHPTMKNPTVLVLTDRNDLDNQIHGNFCLAKDVIPYPKQAETVEDLKEKLNIPSGGIIFTTIQKFQTEHSEDYPQLSERKNIIVIVDEAHRSQYKTLAGNVRQALPNASFIGFTGTPIELRDRSTRVTFGDYISVYTMRQSRQDGNTVPIYYQGRLAKLHLTNEFIDEDFDRITETEEDIIKEKLKSRWAQFEALVGTEERLQKVAHDIVDHFNNRGIEGKAMVVCTSRRIAVRMHEIIKGIPNSPMSAVVITKPEQYGQPHLTKQQRDDLKEWFKDPKHPLKMVIVRDMWLTGYDAPVLHTMYVDKPMKDHTLMQAIARVNRVFRDKPGGLIVDYIGIADDIKKSLGVYDDDVQKESMISIDVAVSMMLEKYDIVKSFFHDVDYSQWWRIEPTSLTHLMQKAHNAVTTNDEIKERFLKECIALSQVYAMVSTEKEAITIRKEILFFQAVRRSVKKYTPSARDTSVEIETSIKQLVSEGISASEVQDIFGFTGEGKRDISILDDDFLKDIQRVEYKNLQVELLKRLINDDISLNMKKNIVQYRSFKEMLEQTIARYSNRSITSAQVIDLLIKQAKELREIPSRAVKLGLTEDEIAFYDAVARGKTHIDDDQKIREIAKKLVVAIKGNLTIDWADRENVKSKIRANVKRILRQEGFTPQEYEPMVPTIMDQAVYLYADYVPMSPEFNVPMGRF
jgi:type I restriction enzyme R subunit